MAPEAIRSDYDPTNLNAPTLNVVEFAGVVKRFGAQTALDGVSFAVKPGSVFALLGENGAGKTTTIRLLLGEAAPDEGKARVFGVSPTHRLKELRERIGYVPEYPTLYDYMTVAEQGRFAAAFYPEGFMKRFAEYCQEYGLDPRAKIKNLSKGMAAKTSLALALAHDPELLALDEPTSGLDALIRREVLQTIADLAALGKTIVLSSHQTAEVERVADHVAFMKRGKLILSEELETLKRTTETLTITLNGRSEVDLTSLFVQLFANELLSSERFGASYTLVGRGLVPNYAETLNASLGSKLLSYNVTQPTLEEIFVAYMNKE